MVSSSPPSSFGGIERGLAVKQLRSTRNREPTRQRAGHIGPSGSAPPGTAGRKPGREFWRGVVDRADRVVVARTLGGRTEMLAEPKVGQLRAAKHGRIVRCAQDIVGLDVTVRHLVHKMEMRNRRRRAAP